MSERGDKLAALKGPANSAQGNALGKRSSRTTSPEGAPYGESIFARISAPFQGLFVLCCCPRALPWAELGLRFQRGVNWDLSAPPSNGPANQAGCILPVVLKHPTIKGAQCKARHARATCRKPL